MTIDANTRRNLEIFQPLRPDGETLSLLKTLDQTRTAMGARLLRSWLGQPLMDVPAVKARQDGVQTFHDSAVLRDQTLSILGKIPDIERAVSRGIEVALDRFSVCGQRGDLSPGGD